jgi:5-methyltetrahydrofolate--homocysteine methyltransferase
MPGKNKTSITIHLKKHVRIAFNVIGKNVPITKPTFLGNRQLVDYPLDEISKYIDWSPFFHTWELKGKYPDIFENKTIGTQARELFKDAQAMLKKVIDEKMLSAKAVIGFYPANSINEDIEIYTDDSRKEILTTFHMLRQQSILDKQPNLALSDYIAPKDSGIKDYMGFFACTAGLGIEPHVKAYEADHDDYNSIMLKAIADRLAEAFAECLHEKVRKELWGYAPNENCSNEDLIKMKYPGIRPAPGYPACPEHTEKRTLFNLLDAENLAEVTLTESFAMLPASSVSGFYFAHPEARYFAVGKLTKDQLDDYTRRKKMKPEELERWLSPYLSYNP